MSSKVKEILKERIESLGYDISWYERILSEQQAAVTGIARQLDDYRAEREEIQAYIEENFPKDVILEQLQRAREELAERGRTTRELINKDTCEVCLLGAVGIAVLGAEFEQDPTHVPFWPGEPQNARESEYHRGAAYEVARALAAELGLPYEAGYPDLYLFNDALDTTDEDVFDLIDRAIEARKEAA